MRADTWLKSTLLSEVRPANAPASISVSEPGSVMLSSAVFRNALLPMTSSPSGRSICVSEVQPLNAAVSIFLRVSGRPTCVSEVQPINRELFRLVIGA